MASPGVLTPEQELLRSSTVQFIEATCPLNEIRSLVGHPLGFRPDYLDQGADLGWFGMLVAPVYGGGSVTERPLDDLALLVQARGKLLQPGPVVAGNVVASALSDFGTEAQCERYLPQLAAGRLLATWAVAGPDGNWERPGVTAMPAIGGGYTLSGAADLVPDAAAADLILITARLASQDGTGQYVTGQFLVANPAAGLRLQPLTGLDLTRRLARLELDQVHVAAECRLPGDDEAVERQYQVALALSVAETVGAMDQLFDLTLQYAKTRYAFGRQIGSFQALKHLLADLSLSLEASKAASTAAIDAVHERVPEAAEITSAVKAFVSDAAIEVSQGCLQVHGGIGYTWEHDLHLYYRRLAHDLVMYGDPNWHRERICRRHGL